LKLSILDLSPSATFKKQDPEGEGRLKS